MGVFSTHSRHNWVALALSIVACELAGGVGALFTSPSIPTWYAGLVKPALNPPAWIFGPVWTLLYALMGVAFFLVWRSTRTKGKGSAYAIFALQLVLNTCWSIIFFGWHQAGAAFAELITLWLAIAVTIVVFHRTARAAAWLLVPYLLWVTFAGYLNFSLWLLN
jgi:tryptophan-rich sensory protein